MTRHACCIVALWCLSAGGDLAACPEWREFVRNELRKAGIAVCIVAASLSAQSAGETASDSKGGGL